MKKMIGISSLFLLTALSAIAAEEKSDAIKINTLGQAWLVNDTTVTASKPNFRLRRAEIKLTATPADNVKFFLMVDAAKALSTSATTVVTATTPATTTTTVNGVNTSGDTKILQDLGVAISPIPELEFTLGQFKTPTTAEGLDSSGELLFPERSIVGRTFGDRREPGGMATYKNYGLKASVMFSNGQGPNVDDLSNKKDLTVRAEYEILPELKVGAFTQAADFSYGTRGRHGMNVRYTTDEFLARVEGVYQSTTDNTVKSNGVMAEVGYTYEKIQPVARFEYYKPDTSATLSGKAFSLGANYFLNKHRAKVQLAATYLVDMSGPNGVATLSSSTSNMKGTLLFLAFSSAL